MDKELIEALGNISINSESAVQIADKYITYLYIENILCVVIIIATFQFVKHIITKLEI